MLIHEPVLRIRPDQLVLVFGLWSREVPLLALWSDGNSRKQPWADIWAGGAVAATGAAGTGASTLR